jgi:hypothetical protein
MFFNADLFKILASEGSFLREWQTPDCGGRVIGLSNMTLARERPPILVESGRAII